MEKILNFITGPLNEFAWGPIMLVLLVGTGIYLTVRTGWLQIRKFGYVIKNTVGSLFTKKDKGEGKNLSQFEAVATAMARNSGDRKHCRGYGRHICGRPGRCFLDVGIGLFRNGHKVQRDTAGRKIQGKG